MRAQIVFMLVVVFLLGGCGPSQKYRYETADEVYTKTASTKVPSQKKEWIESPRFRVYHTYQKPYKTGSSDVYLRTLVVDGRIQFHYIEVHPPTRGTPILFDKAYDINGNELKLVTIHRDTVSLGTSTVLFYSFAVELSEEYLVSATQSGLYVKCVGKRGERVITLEPHYVEGYLKKCRELTEDETTITKEDLTKILKVENNAEAYNARGFAYAYKGQYDQGISDYSKAIELNPRYAEAYSNRGVAYLFKGQYDQAISDYNKAIELNPRYAEAYSNRGGAYYLKRKYHQAIADCTKAIELNPKHADAYNNRGSAFIKLDQPDRGCHDLQKACKLGNCTGLRWFENDGFCR